MTRSGWLTPRHLPGQPRNGIVDVVVQLVGGALHRAGFDKAGVGVSRGCCRRKQSPPPFKCTVPKSMSHP